MPERVIAIIFDCDDTLCPDTISFMLQNYGLSPEEFWRDIDTRVRLGWDPPHAYMNRILELVHEGRLGDLTRSNLIALGGRLPLFAGLPDAFIELRNFVKDDPELSNARVTLEFYIVSGGLEEMIRGSALGSHADGIFGCNFEHDSKTDLPFAVKSTVSFTEKTRFVFAIHKGVSAQDARTNPYLVNDAIPDKERRIPIKNMVYVGDGPSDIPCLSLITKGGGEGIGVSPATGTFAKAYEMARGERISVGPYTADYRSGTDMRKALKQIILTKGLELAVEARKHVVPAPRHGGNQTKR